MQHQHRHSSLKTRVGLLALGAMFGSLVGCVADNSEKPKVGPPPTHPQPSQMFMAAQAFRDTNSNGYLDSGLLTVYIFQTGYARSVQIPGEFTLKMVGKGGTAIREWKLAAPGPNVRKVVAGVGPGYVIALSLLEDQGTDVLPGQSADILAMFTDAEGRSIQAEQTTVLVGKPQQP